MSDNNDEHNDLFVYAAEIRGLIEHECEVHGITDRDSPEFDAIVSRAWAKVDKYIKEVNGAYDNS